MKRNRKRPNLFCEEERIHTVGEIISMMMVQYADIVRF